MLSEKSFDAGAVTLNYAEGAANGAPLVFLHGLSDRWQGLGRLIALLEDDWHVYACDMRGHGKSGRAASYRAIDYFADITAFLKSRVGSPAVVLGHSNGALAAIGAAAQTPESVEAIVLLDPPFLQREASRPPGSTGDFLKGISDILNRKRTVREFFSEFAPGIGEIGLRWFEETLSLVDPGVLDVVIAGRYLEGLKLEESLDAIVCPALMLYGEVEKGGLVRESDVSFFLAHARKGEAVQIKGTGHFLQAEQPKKIADAMSGWLERVHSQKKG